MDKFFEIAEKVYKPAAKIAGILIGILALYVIGTTIHAASIFSGWFTFLYVLYWIAVVVLILSGLYVALKWFMGADKKKAAQPQYTQPVQNAQPVQPVQPVQQVQQVQPQTQTTANGTKICPQCGSSVPAGNPFCTNCGNKMN